MYVYIFIYTHLYLYTCIFLLAAEPDARPRAENFMALPQVRICTYICLCLHIHVYTYIYICT